MRKRLFVIGSLFISIILFLFLKNTLASITTHNTVTAAFPIQEKDISHMIIENGDQANMLYKKNDEWYLEKDSIQYLADNERITSIIHAILGIKKINPVSTNKNNHGEFGIGTQKITIKYNNGNDSKNSAVIYIGNSNQGSKNFIRINNEDEIYSVNGFDSVFSDMEYRDLAVHFVKDESTIASVKLEYDDTTVELEKKNSTWIVDKKEAKQDRIDFFLNNLKTVRASDIVVSSTVDESTLTDSFTITVKEDGTEKVIEFYPKDENSYYAKMNENNLYYIVPSAEVDGLKKQSSDFTE